MTPARIHYLLSNFYKHKFDESDIRQVQEYLESSPPDKHGSFIEEDQPWGNPSHTGIGEILPKNRYLGISENDNRVISAWIVSAGSVENFLRNINAPEEIVQFIVQQEDEKLQSILANEVRKNPQISVNDLRAVVEKFHLTVRYQPTQQEYSIAEEYSDDPKFHRWVLLQIRRFRLPTKTDDDRYNYRIPIDTIAAHLPLIHSWVRDTSTDIDSYTYERAATLSEEYEARNRKGKKDISAYETNVVIHRFPNGWTIKHLITSNDLIAEGHRMKNCLRDTLQNRGSVADRYYYSLRDPQNNPHVTIKMNSSPASRSSKIKTIDQIRGVANSYPKAEYVRMVRDWLKKHKSSIFILDNQLNENDVPYLDDVSNKENVDLMWKTVKEHTRILKEKIGAFGTYLPLNFYSPNELETLLNAVWEGIRHKYSVTDWDDKVTIVHKRYIARSIVDAVVQFFATIDKLTSGFFENIHKLDLSQEKIKQYVENSPAHIFMKFVNNLPKKEEDAIIRVAVGRLRSGATKIRNQPYFRNLMERGA